MPGASGLFSGSDSSQASNAGLNSVRKRSSQKSASRSLPAALAAAHSAKRVTSMVASCPPVVDARVDSVRFALASLKAVTKAKIDAHCRTALREFADALAIGGDDDHDA